MASTETEAVKGGQTANVEPKQKGKSDDKCIGNRRFRTMILCVICATFGIFAFGQLWLLVEDANDLDDSFDGVANWQHGARLIFSGLIFSLVFLIVTLVLLFFPACNPSTSKQARLPGLGLLLGAFLYIFGWVLYITGQKEAYNYEALPSDTQEDLDAAWVGQFGEALLFGATVAFMAIDMLIPARLLFESEFNRLLGNLAILLTVAVLEMPAYFIIDADGAWLVGTGYIVIFIVGLVYMVLYLFTCCKTAPGIKDSPMVRKVLAALLLLGGVLTAIGYYWIAGGGDTLGGEGDEAKRVAFYIGYTILAGGLCTVWALDIAWDDIKDD